MDSTGSLLSSQSRKTLDELGDYEPSTAQEAQAFIEKIRAEKGYLGVKTLQDLNKLPVESREEILRIIEKKRRTEASYTKSVSDDLYSSKFRFLFELIQNADDSSYSKANANGRHRCLKFTITPQALIVETNEDGFRRADVNAICSTGESSKKTSASSEHIGEKGFGFKSVFTIADEVRVQSGIWSFRFEHLEGEDGLGMVTPLDAPSEQLPIWVTTRITLRLSQSALRDHQRLVDEITGLPDTTILFLQRLQRITMLVTGASSRKEEIVIQRRNHLSVPGLFMGRRSLTRTKTLGDGHEETKETGKDTYYIQHYVKNQMPKDRRRKDRMSANISIAFPVRTGKKQPKISKFGEYVFAYLPLQKIRELPFLIHSDFIASASRETIRDCAWNHAIRDGAATAFAKAIKNFATHDHPLRYSWLDYLPTESDDHFWKPLLPSINKLLRTMPILQTWKGRRFQEPTTLRRLLPMHLHHNEPIFPDLGDEVYLAPDYSEDHYARLENIGIRHMDWDSTMERVRFDLVKTTSSLKTRPANDPWHESCATLLLNPFRYGHLHAQRLIKQLAIIPLAGGNRWAGAPGFSFGGVETIYFPFTQGVPIPTDISLHLVEPTAAVGPKRNALFKELGVNDCPKETVIKQIEAVHKSSRSFTLTSYKTHIRYLFQFHTYPKSLRSWMLVCSGKKILRGPVPFYFPSAREYDTQQLLPQEFFDSQTSVARLLDASLVDLRLANAAGHSLLWEEWLQETTGARFHPPLTAVESLFKYDLSEIVLSILEHSPEKLVGMLRAHWTEYKQDVSHVKDQLMECQIPCETGDLHPLRSTYLPTEPITLKLRDLEAEDNFPLLKLPSTEAFDYTEWQFLERLGVRSTIDLDFYLIILTNILDDDLAPSIEVLEKVYTSMASSATLPDQERLRQFFCSRKSIGFLNRNGDVTLHLPSDCVWTGPDFLRLKKPLEKHYKEFEGVEMLLHVFVGIRNYSVKDVLDELGSNLLFVDLSHSAAETVYAFLDQQFDSQEDWRTIREAFATKRLVLGEDGTWHSLQSCLWRSPFSLSNFQDLSVLYPNLENFFVKRLKVETAHPSMLINEINNMAKRNAPHIGDIRQRLVEVGKMVAKIGVDTQVSKALDRLSKVKFLPKKAAHGSSELVGIDDDFAVNDHKRFGDAFAEESVLLDFTIEESNILNTVFEHMSLTHHYLSTAVSEESTVGDDAIENEVLGKQLRAKAYALYCCAARYKSVRALREERDLFDELSQIQIYTTDNISTDLVLRFSSSMAKVQSNRLAVHYELSEGALRIYVPQGQKERKGCYRSQLPTLLVRVLDVPSGATHAVSLILGCDIAEIDDILLEQDIPAVDWIERPIIEIPIPPESERPSTPPFIEQPQVSEEESSTSPPAILTPSSDRLNSGSSPLRTGTPGHTSVVDGAGTPPYTPPRRYERLVEQVVRSAQRANYNHNGGTIPVRNAPPEDDLVDYDFDHVETFGNRDANQMAHDRRIGAAGEAYSSQVFEILSNLSLPRFGRENWRSTIRGELQTYARYADMNNWEGRETADIVYKDQDGTLTRYLRQHCSGGFPEGIREDRDLTTEPIEYYLEVKTTTSACSTRFFMSGSQYQRMQDYTVHSFGHNYKVYVILRVFNLSSEVGLRIFVDPLRLRGQHLDFEIGTWHCKVKDI